MIIDFSYPNFHADGWKVKVVKTTKDNKLYVQTMRFEDKDDAFEYYEKVHALWLAEKDKLRETVYAKENQTRHSR